MKKLEGSSFRQLLKRCTELKLFPCSGKGINKKTLEKRIQDYENSSERNFLERDPEYYEEIKDIINEMPDIRPFQSEEIKATLSPWTNEKRWNYLLMDLETLDNAVVRGDESDIKYIEYIQAFHNISWSKRENLRMTIKTKDIHSFFITYPALGWILLRTDKNARPGAIEAGYHEWIDTIYISDEERIKLAPYAKSMKTIKYLLDPYNDLSRIEESRYGNAACYLLYGRGAGFNNVLLYDYLLDKGYIPERKEFIVETGDLPLIQKLHTIFPIDVDKEIVTAAIKSRRPESLRFIISIGGDYNYYNWVDTSYFEMMAKRGDLDMIKVIADTGGHLDDIFRVSIEFIHLDIIRYLIEERNMDLPLPYIFKESVNDPKVLEYLILQFQNRMTREHWNEALAKSIISLNEESLNILLKYHDYTLEEVEKISKHLWKPNQRQLLELVKEKFY